MPSVFESTRSGTIYGEPVGKFMLGSISPEGQDAALAGKWIGASSIYSFPSYRVPIPKRQRLSGTGIVEGVIIGLALAWILGKWK